MKARAWTSVAARRPLLGALPGVLLGVLLGALGPVVVAPAADASVTTLCTGYAVCAKAAMSASGYAGSNDNSYWRMYTGHNCTNYAAYRMVKSGLANVRPWDGGGNATYWGSKMPRITNSTPRVGAVAWWKAGVDPAGSAGHVAYVERVVSPSEIIVSQDSWGGTFSWARVTKTGPGWPSGFIHFNDVPLRNLTKPAISGTPKVGATLTVSAGTWNPSDATVRYQWLANGTAISGATRRTFVPTAAYEGKILTVKVTASKLGYPTTSVLTVGTPALQPGVIRNTAVPRISGQAMVDKTLTAYAGAWYPQPDSLTLQWYADGAPIAGADAASLRVDPSLVGKALTLRVTAVKDGYTDVAAASTPTSPVAPGIHTLTKPALVTGPPVPGQILELTGPTVVPSANQTVQWLRGGVPVPGANAATYRLTLADLGARIAARVALTRPGYTTVVTRTSATPRVRSTPRIRMSIESTHGRLVVNATVAAKGVSPVTGVLRLRSHGKVLAEKRLRAGAARLRVTGLTPGARTFHLVYKATATVSRGVLDRTITIH